MRVEKHGVVPAAGPHTAQDEGGVTTRMRIPTAESQEICLPRYLLGELTLPFSIGGTYPINIRRQQGG